MIFQVILALSAELDHENDRDLAAIRALLNAVVKEIGVGDNINRNVYFYKTAMNSKIFKMTYFKI